MNVQQRQAIERQIVEKIVDDALTAGYKLSVDNGGYSPEILLGTDRAAVLAAMFATDDETLIFSMDDGGKVKRVGDVYFVYGNSGWDVINDHVDNAEVRMILREAEALADKIEAEQS